MAEEISKRTPLWERVARFMFPTFWDSDQDQCYPEGTELAFHQWISILEGSGMDRITYGAVDRILDAFIEAVDKEGLTCGGGVGPADPDEPLCHRCDGLGLLRQPETPVSVRLAEDMAASNGISVLNTVEAWVLVEWYCQLDDITLDELRHYRDSGEIPEGDKPHFAQLLDLLRRVEG